MADITSITLPNGSSYNFKDQTARQELSNKINTSLKGASNGVAELDSTGKVPSSQLPSYVDDVLEYDSLSNFPTTGETGKIYVAKDTNKTYRWSGTAYVEISPSLALGETSSTAYRGDRGKTAYDHSQSTHARIDATAVTSSSTNGNIKINGTETTVYTHPGSGTNPHGTTKSDVGLGNVGNFKAVSTVANQGLTDTEKSNARTNIGAGTSSLTLGATSSTACPGDKGTVAYNHAVAKGISVSTGLYKIATNSEGHLASTTPVAKSDITALGIPGSDTTYSDATTSTHGLMSSTDKKLFDEIVSKENTTYGPSDIVSFNSDISKPVKNLKVNIEPIQSGTGDPSPTNVRPISGWTGCNVTRTGSNICDEVFESGSINTSGNNTSNTTRIRTKNYIPCRPNTSYYAEFSDENGLGLRYFDVNKIFLGSNYNKGITTRTVFTTPSGAYYLRFSVADTTVYKNNIAINYPSTDTAYHPGTGNVTFPISWQSEAGTVYGGTLDVTSGVLTVTMGYVDLGTLTWGYQSDILRFTSTAPAGIQLPPSNSVAANLICSSYKTTSSSDTGSSSYNGVIGLTTGRTLCIRDSAYTDAATFEAAMSGVQLVYELAQPQTYQLDPVMVSTSLGQNNIWADCGQTTLTDGSVLSSIQSQLNTFSNYFSSLHS